MTELEEIELALADPCLSCEGRGSFQIMFNGGGSYWCHSCGGSGKKITRTEGGYQDGRSTAQRPPYLNEARWKKLV